MRPTRNVVWIIIHGEKAGGYTTPLSQKEVDHAQAVARNEEGKPPLKPQPARGDLLLRNQIIPGGDGVRRTSRSRL